MTEPESPLVELRKMVIAQKTVLLPPEAADPALAALHAALQEYDRLVSQAVIAAIQQRPVDVSAAEIHAAQAAARSAFHQPNLPVGRELTAYQKYMQRLDRMAELINLLA